MRALALLVVLAAPAAAIPGVGGSFVAKVEDVQTALINNASEPRLKVLADRMADQMPRTSIAVAVDLRGSPRETNLPSKAATVAEIFAEARARSEAAREVPPPEILEAMDAAEAFLNGRLLRYAELEPHILGMYKWLRDADDEWIELNESLSWLSMYLGRPVAYAIVIHEIAHAIAKRLRLLSAARVRDGEVYAFGRQWRWLKHIDPTGHKLAQLRVALERRLRVNPRDQGAREALAVATTLDVLRGLSVDNRDEEPDFVRIGEYVDSLGYREGHEHPDGRHPSA